MQLPEVGTMLIVQKNELDFMENLFNKTNQEKL